MDDVTNTMNTAAAAEPQQPAVRVRVVDATTRKTMTDEAEVVFVPCADSEPIKLKNAALSSRNLDHVDTIRVDQMNAFELLNHRYLLVDKASLQSFLDQATATGGSDDKEAA